MFAGVRSDPFFFDLTGFVGTVFGVGDDNLEVIDMRLERLLRGAQHQRLVIEVPDGDLGGRNIGVWGIHLVSQRLASGCRATRWVDPRSTPCSTRAWSTRNAGATKNAFNSVKPFRQLTALDGQFRKNIVTTLTNINQVLGTDDAFGCSD